MQYCFLTRVTNATLYLLNGLVPKGVISHTLQFMSPIDTILYLLNDVVPEDIVHEIQRVGVHFREHEVLLVIGGNLQLLLNEPTAVLVSTGQGGTKNDTAACVTGRVHAHRRAKPETSCVRAQEDNTGISGAPQIQEVQQRTVQKSTAART